jgi:hypothetical protein
MKLFKIFLGFFLIVLSVIIVSRFFPHTYHVEKSIIINKPRQEVFGYMAHMKNWEEWSLWNKSIDSTLYYFYNLKQDTLGARQYIRAQLIGDGYFELTEFKRDSLLHFNLVVNKGDRTAAGTFLFTPVSANTTLLTWIDSGDVGFNPLKRFMIPFVTKSTAETLERGLLSIKTKIEKSGIYRDCYPSTMN